jgi:DNA-binding transcriptional ArsR family regulator
MNPIGKRVSDQFSALGHPTRLGIILTLAEMQPNPVNLSYVSARMSLPDPSTSHHMKILVECGLVSRVQQGKYAVFRLIHQTFKELILVCSIPLKAEMDKLKMKQGA